jgi:signal transduction histidine kinase
VTAVALAAAGSGWAAAVSLWLATRRERARAAEQVARASHELRGPLTAATLGLELAARRQPSPALRAVELQLRRIALALSDLAGDGAGHDLSAAVELRALVADCVESYVPAGAARGVAVRIGQPGAAAWVQADPVRIAQAVGNLIANAIEHGGGPVEVAVLGEPRRVRVEVADAGPGLNARVDDLVRRPRAGRGSRGRGLAVAAAIAGAHGGRLSAAPSGSGARLVLELPALAADRALAPAE